MDVRVFSPSKFDFSVSACVCVSVCFDLSFCSARKEKSICALKWLEVYIWLRIRRTYGDGMTKLVQIKRVCNLQLSPSLCLSPFVVHVTASFAKCRKVTKQTTNTFAATSTQTSKRNQIEKNRMNWINQKSKKNRQRRWEELLHSKSIRTL